MISTNNKTIKKKRNRKFLSCFTCRSLRQKCDRKRPSCSRCIFKGNKECKYMNDDMDKHDYAKHLVKHGLSDARLEKTLITKVTKSDVNSMDLNDDSEAIVKKKPTSSAFTQKKVAFVLPEPISQKKIVNKSNQYSAKHYVFNTANEHEPNVMNESKSPFENVSTCLVVQPTSADREIKIINCLENQVFGGNDALLKTMYINKSSSTFENEIFQNDREIKNDLYLSYQARNGCLTSCKYEITAVSVICIIQVLNRVFEPKIWNVWRFMTMDFLQSIDSKVYKRLEFTKLKKKPAFENKWTGEQSENLLERLLECIPRKFDTFSKIVMCYFETDLHKTFDIISQKVIKQKLKQIFTIDENNTIVKIQLLRFENQYYLGMIITMFTMMVDPELYYHDVFKEINKLIVSIKFDNFKYALVKCQYFLIVFAKNQLHFKSSFLKDSGSVGDLVNWAFQVDFLNLIKNKESINSSHKDVVKMKNIWYMLLYIETLLYLEVGRSLRFKINIFDQSHIDIDAEGIFGWINKYSVFIRKIILCVENPYNKVDLGYLISKIDEFISVNLSDLPTYLDIRSKKCINFEEFMVLNPLMSFKVSLMCHKYSLMTKELKKIYRDELLGVLFASRRIQMCQQNMCLSKAREYEERNDISGEFALTSKIDQHLKTDEILPDNKNRPQWLYKYILPVYGLSAEDELSDKAVTITEAIALEMLSEDISNGVFNNQASMDLEDLEILAVSLINKGFLKNDNVKIREYTYYDLLILDKIWIEKVDHFSKLLPARVSFPMCYSLVLVLKLLLTIDICMDNKDEIKKFEDFATKFETITIRRQGESGVSTGVSSALVTDYNTTDYESIGRRSRASSCNSLWASLNLTNPKNNLENNIKVDEDALNSEILLGSLPATPGLNIGSGSEGIFFQTNVSTPKYTDIDLEEMGLDNFEFNTFMKLFN
ncbi:hypothetical protein ACO0R3_003241 [Hanseniaspora guilliermondii]